MSGCCCKRLCCTVHLCGVHRKEVRKKFCVKSSDCPCSCGFFSLCFSTISSNNLQTCLSMDGCFFSPRMFVCLFFLYWNSFNSSRQLGYDPKPQQKKILMLFLMLGPLTCCNSEDSQFRLSMNLKHRNKLTRVFLTSQNRDLVPLWQSFAFHTSTCQLCTLPHVYKQLNLVLIHSSMFRLKFCDSKKVKRHKKMSVLLWHIIIHNIVYVVNITTNPKESNC